MPPIVQSGALPLHHAVNTQASLEVVTVLLNAFPDSASTPDKVLYVVLCAHVCFMSFMIAYIFFPYLHLMNIFLRKYYIHTHIHMCA